MTVTVVQGDVGRAVDVSRMFEAIAATARPLAGIVHSAGATDDGVLVQQHWSRFEKVMDAKVRGTWLLHQHTAALPLDFFVLFSTGASFLGSAGQSNHAAANMFLDALAHHRRARGLSALAINWGAWSQIGAATRGGVVERAATRGLRPISPEQGLRVFEHLLGTATAQVAVLPIEWTEFVAWYADGKRLPLFERIATERDAAVALSPEAAAPPVAPRSGSADQLKGMAPARARARIAEWVHQDAARVLGLVAGDVIDPARPLNALGLDSLMAVELRNVLGVRC